MCKDEWNAFNSNDKKLANYHKGTKNHTSFWELYFEKKERFHLLHQYNKKIMN